MGGAFLLYQIDEFLRIPVRMRIYYAPLSPCFPGRRRTARATGEYRTTGGRERGEKFAPAALHVRFPSLIWAIPVSF